MGRRGRPKKVEGEFKSEEKSMKLYKYVAPVEEVYILENPGACFDCNPGHKKGTYSTKVGVCPICGRDRSILVMKVLGSNVYSKAEDTQEKEEEEDVISEETPRESVGQNKKKPELPTKQGSSTSSTPKKRGRPAKSDGRKPEPISPEPKRGRGRPKKIQLF